MDSLTSLSCQGESAETLELGEIQVCNKSSETDADMTSIAVEDIYKSTDQPQDRPESTKTDRLESEIGYLRTDLSHLESAVEYMKAEITDLQKSKLAKICGDN